MKTEPSFLQQLPQYNRYKVETIYACLINLLALDSRPIKIMDVGCGTGELLTLPLSQLLSIHPGVTILGTDIHNQSIQRAIKNAQQSGLRNLSFSANSDQWQHELYDIVICSEVFEHVADTRNFLSILKRCVKPDGFLVITLPNGLGAFEIESFVYHKMGIKKIWRGLKKLLRVERFGVKSLPIQNIQETLNEENNVHIHHFKYWEFLKILKDPRFQKITSRGIILFGGPLSYRLMERLPWLFRLNVRLAQKLPAYLAASWIFICEG